MTDNQDNTKKIDNGELPEETPAKIEDVTPNAKEESDSMD